MTRLSRQVKIGFMFWLLWVALCTMPPGVIASNDPLPMDPAIRTGTLPNGVTYWVRSHATPPGKIALWMHVATGSLNEADGQEGIAHYLEHMAFNGTQHFPPGALVTFFESLGLRFGQHQNAFTSFTQTTYTLTLPNTQSDTLDKGLTYFADVASGMLLTTEEIDKERRVILEEQRARKGVQQRLLEKLLPELLPGTRVSRRQPIGLEDTVSRVQRSDFLNYYHTWYHPAKVTVLAVGDVPTDTLVTAIARHFAAWHRNDPPPQDEPHSIQPYDAPRAIVLTDPEVTTANIEMFALFPRHPRTTVAAMRQQLVDRLGTWMLNRRTEQRIQEGSAPYQTAQARATTFLGVAESVSAEVDAAPTNWAAAFAEILADIQRARQHGFTPQELQLAQKAMIAAAEHAAQTEATYDAQAFISAMNRARGAGEYPRSAAQNLQLLQQLLPGITLAEVTSAFTANFAPDRKAYVLTLPEQPGLEVPSRDTLLTLAQETLKKPAEPWQAKERPTSLLAKDPAPGSIAERSHYAPLQVTQVTFANNVRLHYRYMDFKKDHVTVSLTLPGGVIRETTALRGITEVATLPLSTPATSQLSSTDIRDLMTGKKVTVTGRAVDDALVLEIAGPPESIEDGLRLAYLLLTDARIEPASVSLWQSQRLQHVAATRTHIATRAKEETGLVLSGNDHRLAPLTPTEVEARAKAIPEAQDWLNSILRTAPMEVAIVGDMPEDRALQLAATYLGSLPPRPRRDETLLPLRQVAGFTGPLERLVDVETITPRAHPILLWRGPHWQDVRGRRLMFQAMRILESRVRQELREDRGLTYSASTYVNPSRVYPDVSALFVEFTTDPEKMTEAMALVRTVVERFAAEGPSDEELETARKQFVNIFETTIKDPRFWVNLLGDLEYHASKLEDIDGVVEKVLAFTKEEILAEVRKTVRPERFAMIVARPKTPVTVEATPQPAPTAPSAVQ